jgi:hypothetical protein
MAPSLPNLVRAPHPIEVGGIFLTCVLAGVLVGAMVNAVNGLVSPHYFIAVLRWDHLPADAVWHASIVQGMLEGFACGCFLAAVFTVGTGIITGDRCSYQCAVKQLAGILAGACGFWILGGLAAIGLATLSPDFYRAAFIGVPDDFDARLGYAWVGGSIWGVQVGGLLSVVVSLVVLRANWRGECSPS